MLTFEENLPKTAIEKRIHQKAGPELLKEKQILAHLTNQYPQITKGYKLFAKQVLHITFPPKNETKKLADIYKQALQLAVASGAKTIAFPCIESNTNTAKIALQTTKHFLLNNFKLEKVYFVDLDNRKLEPYRNIALLGL